MYDIEMTYQAKKDFDCYIDTIAIDFDAPMTAALHYKGLSDIIDSLKQNAEVYSIRNSLSLSKYGTFVRRVNFKKMAIIYTIRDTTVVIQRIIASSLITE